VAADRPWVNLVEEAMRSPPARRGDPIEAVDTPALIVDLPALESNLREAAARVSAFGVALRPHAKAHKCVEIARRQIAAGAVGICCQKTEEAQVFVNAGITDVLISNEVVGAAKAKRVAALARQARIAVCVDHPGPLAELAQAAQAAGVTLEVLIEVDVGQGRCGVTEVGQALALAREIRRLQPAVMLCGLQAYHGGAQHLRVPQARADAIARACATAGRFRDALQAEGFACPTITGAGTGTLTLELESGLYTEVQPGSYALMDADYAANERGAHDPVFSQALGLLASVVSARNGHAVLDAGLKATSAESGLPVCREPGWVSRSISDEHLVLKADPARGALGAAGVSANTALLPGDRVMLTPAHCDPTVNLHDWLVVVQEGLVVDLWPVDARGALG
jgi:D-serine deaminase-like pyridoxal phosphate-dependent protein